MAIQGRPDEAAERFSPVPEPPVRRPRRPAVEPLTSPQSPETPAPDLAAPPSVAHESEAQDASAESLAAPDQLDGPVVQQVRRLRQRELDTDGIPLPRPPRGMVVEAHRNIQKRQARRQQQLAASQPVGELEGGLSGGSPALEQNAAASPEPAPVTPQDLVLPRPPVARPVGGAAFAEPASAAAPLLSSEALEVVPRRRSVAVNPPPTTSAAVQRWETEWQEIRRAELDGQCCGKCRDYRTSEMSGRGWCVNPFAFPTRQLVGEEDLACLGPLGSWWVVSDDYWLTKVKTLPNEPTPLTDGMLQLLMMLRRSSQRS